MSKKVRVGIIGAGSIATHIHMPSLAEIDNCEIVAICDLRPERATALAEKYGVKKTYVSYPEMLANEEMDAVFCLVNPDCTFRIARDCMEAGFHVMTEKPAGIDAFQAHSLERTSAKTGKICGVAMNRRHIPLVTEVLKKMREVTEITQIDGRFMKFSEVHESWDYASAFNCDIVHAVDLVRFIAQAEPKNVSSVVGRFNSPVDNAWSSVIEFDNGILATLRANYQAGARIHDFEIHGPGASAFINIGFGDMKCEATILYNNGQVIYSAASTGVGGEREIEHLDGIELAGESEYYQYYGYKTEDADFINAIANGTKPLCVIDDEAKTMDMIETMLKNRIN